LKKSYNLLTYLNIYMYIYKFDVHGLLLLYDRNIMCSSKTINYHSGLEFIGTTFNEGHRKVIHVITLYGSYVTSIFFN
jgi:hypothetical protein